MKGFKQHLNEKADKLFFDEVPNWSVDPKIYALAKKNGNLGKNGAEGVFDMPKSEAVLFPLNDYDKKLYAGTKLKSGEVLFRYITYTTAVGGLSPVVKVNVRNKMVYFNKPEASDADILDFEPRGFKPKWMRLRKEYETM